jgi:hypothetical protein
MFIILLLISLPAIALSLFQLTCIVIGSGKNNKFWWCNTYAWVLTGLIIFYSINFIIYAVLYYNKSETFVENVGSNNNSSNIDNTGLFSSNIYSNTSDYTTSNITNMYQGATYIPYFEKNNNLTIADVLNSR